MGKGDRTITMKLSLQQVSRMQQISVTEASEQLSQLIDAALAGEEIIIIRDHYPVVKLTPLANLPKRYPAKAGSAKGLVWISDDFDEPLEEFKI